MQSWFRIVLVVALLLGGLPHAFCACGHAEAAQKKSAPSCRHCCEGRSEPEPDQPEPCQCRPCRVVNATPPGPPASVPPPQPNPSVSLIPVALSVQDAGDALPEQAGGAAPPGSLPPPSCGLAILLEQLLL